MLNKNTCPHPKKRIAKYFDKQTSTYIERCIKCTCTLYTRKFPRVAQ
jgi:hypothetical protein